LAILLWIVKKQQWRMLGGAVAGYGTATLLAFWFNPNSLDYFGKTYHVAVATSCGIGGVLRDVFGTGHVWLQFLPSVVGLAWFAFYWRQHGSHWNWRVHLPLLLIVSVNSSPYFWDHDFILIVPAVIAVAAEQGYRNFATLVAYLAVQAVSFAGYGWGFSIALRCATGILWIPFYLIAVTELRSISHPKNSHSVTTASAEHKHGL
jgi:hypothetical protein